MNGPLLELLAAIWNESVVCAGIVAVQASDVHAGVAPAAGMLSWMSDVKSPLAA